jgi:hypothetical protein
MLFELSTMRRDGAPDLVVARRLELALLLGLLRLLLGDGALDGALDAGPAGAAPTQGRGQAAVASDLDGQGANVAFQLPPWVAWRADPSWLRAVLDDAAAGLGPGAGLAQELVQVAADAARALDAGDGRRPGPCPRPRRRCSG